MTPPPTGGEGPRTPPLSRHRGPSLALLALVFTGLFLAALAVSLLMSGGARFPTPYDPPEVARAYFARHADALRVTAFLQFASAIPLGLFAATVASRLRFLGMDVAGASIALFGGFAASFFLALSALAQWTLAQPGVAGEAGPTRVLQLLAFATGGPGHVAPLGLLLAGVSVPAWFGRLLPRWLVWLGLIVAGIAEFSTLSLVLTPAAILLPLGRFPAFIWLIGTGFALPAARERSGAAPAAASANA